MELKTASLRCVPGGSRVHGGRHASRDPGHRYPVQLLQVHVRRPRPVVVLVERLDELLVVRRKLQHGGLRN
jgi:hypothetical protein